MATAQQTSILKDVTASLIFVELLSSLILFCFHDGCCTSSDWGDQEVRHLSVFIILLLNNTLRVRLLAKLVNVS